MISGIKLQMTLSLYILNNRLYMYSPFFFHLVHFQTDKTVKGPTARFGHHAELVPIDPPLETITACSKYLVWYFVSWVPYSFAGCCFVLFLHSKVVENKNNIDTARVVHV